MTQTITLEQVLTEGRKAYEEGRLSAQGPTPACNYRDVSGCPCVVGAAMTAETVAILEEKFLQGCTFRQLFDKELVDAPFNDVPAIQVIQNGHDEWCKALQKGQGAEEAEAEFRRLLYRE